VRKVSRSSISRLRRALYLRRIRLICAQGRKHLKHLNRLLRKSFLLCLRHPLGECLLRPQLVEEEALQLHLVAVVPLPHLQAEVFLKHQQVVVPPQAEVPHQLHQQAEALPKHQTLNKLHQTQAAAKPKRLAKQLHAAFQHHLKPVAAAQHKHQQAYRGKQR
jgi:hypothetical protein